MNDRPKSNLYERCVAAWAIEEFDFVDVTVTANAKVRGHISGRSRQVDVLLEERTIGNPEGRIIVEAKLHGRPVDIEVVEAVEAKLRDVNAAHAVIVSSGGFTQSAISRGDELIQLTLLEYDHVVNEYSDAFGSCLADSNCGAKSCFPGLPSRTERCAVQNFCGPSTRLMVPVPVGLCTNTGNV
jgi:hypothetical protein